MNSTVDAVALRHGHAVSHLSARSASQPSVSVALSRCTVVCECVMAGGGGVDEWLRAVLVVLCAVNILGQVTHVDPVGYPSREGTVCYDNGRPQVLCSACYCMLCIV